MNQNLRQVSIVFLIVFLSIFKTSAQTKPENYVQHVSGMDKNLVMVFIEGGAFNMGSTEKEPGHKTDEAPQHRVRISPFWMSEVEITWDLYNLFMSRDLDSSILKETKGGEVQLEADAVSGATTPYVDMSFGMGVEGFPAISMTQLAAARFCQWLSALTGYFYRLPTEAEWEYACRAGTDTAYYFGNDHSNLADHAWFSGNSNNVSHKVAEKEPNSWGLYDMHGNVAEWTLDHYDETGYMVAKGLVEDPVNMNANTFSKAVRGGSWMDTAEGVRSASRKASSKKWKMRDPQIPKSRWWLTDAPFVGFRVVRPVKTPSLKEQNLYWNLKKD